MRTVTLVFFLLVSYCYGIAKAGDLTAEDYIELCKDAYVYGYDEGGEDTSKLLCMFFTQGVLQGINTGYFVGYLEGRKPFPREDTEDVISKGTDFSRLGVCKDPKREIVDYIRVAYKHIKFHKKTLDKEADMALYVSWREAYPIDETCISK